MPIPQRPKTEPHPGARPMALLVLAFGVAIGGTLAATPVRTIDPAAQSSTFDRPSTPAAPADLGQRPVRVIPLPARDDPRFPN